MSFESGLTRFWSPLFRFTDPSQKRDFERFIAGRRTLLDARLAAVELKAKGGLLPDVTFERGVLKITPIEKSTPPEPRPWPHASTRCCRGSTGTRSETCDTRTGYGRLLAHLVLALG